MIRFTHPLATFHKPNFNQPYSHKVRATALARYPANVCIVMQWLSLVMSSQNHQICEITNFSTATLATKNLIAQA